MQNVITLYIIYCKIESLVLWARVLYHPIN